MEIEVKGHSGCSIDIIRQNGKLIISKCTFDSKYVDRLSHQAEKQKNAYKLDIQHIRVPQVISVEKDASHCNVKMEYVYSRNFIEFFEVAGFEQIDYFIKALKLWIELDMKNSRMLPVEKKEIVEKFEGVKQKIKTNVWIDDSDDINDLLRQSERVFCSLPPLISIPVGQCHGDLTFSNILFNGNNYYLIDFLDSFIETPLMDMVKIRQDSRYLWSTQMYTGKYDTIRLQIISQKIDEELNGWFKRYEWYNSFYMSFQLMNFLRILQYAKEEKNIIFLKEIIKQILDNEESNSNSGS